MQAASTKKHRLGEITRKQFLVNKITQIAHKKSTEKIFGMLFALFHFILFHLNVFLFFLEGVQLFTICNCTKAHTRMKYKNIKITTKQKNKIKQWDLNEHKMKSNSRNTHKTAAMRKIVWLENWKLTKKKKKRNNTAQAKENEFIYEQAEFITNTAPKCEMNNLENRKSTQRPKDKNVQIIFKYSNGFQLEKLNSIHLLGLHSFFLVFLLLVNLDFILIQFHCQPKKEMEKAHNKNCFYLLVECSWIQFIVCQPHIYIQIHNRQKEKPTKKLKVWRSCFSNKKKTS